MKGWVISTRFQTVLGGTVDVKGPRALPIQTDSTLMQLPLLLPSPQRNTSCNLSSIVVDYAAGSNQINITQAAHSFPFGSCRHSFSEQCLEVLARGWSGACSRCLNQMHITSPSPQICRTAHAHTSAYIEVHSGQNPVSEIYLLACSGGRDIPKWLRVIGFTVFISVYPSLVSSLTRIHFDIITISQVFHEILLLFMCSSCSSSRGLHAISV